MKRNKKFYIQHLETSFANAEKLQSKITQEILDLEGMTGQMTRHFYNNLLSMDDARYLEIGTWKGSSVCSAMYGNKADVVCVDNWSEFDGANIKSIFIELLNKFKGQNKAKFIEGDCFKLDVSTLGKFNIYLYDGGHSYEDHFEALNYYKDCLDDTFIFLVDDWNWSWVRNGTFKSFSTNKFEVLWKKEVILSENDEVTSEDLLRSTWWNGIGIFLVKQKKSKRIIDKVKKQVKKIIRK